MTVVPARRHGGRTRRRKSVPNVHAKGYGNLCIGASPRMKKAHQIEAGHSFLQEESLGFDEADVDSSESSGSETSRASQEDEFPGTLQHSNPSEGMAHAVVRGFRVGAAKKLPEFLERKASPSHATTDEMVGIKEVFALPIFPAVVV